MESISPADSGSPVVVVETWILHCAGGRWKSAPAVRTMMDSSAHPHVYAAAAASAAGVMADVVHSTSWRMEGERIVLTYIVVSENALGEESFDVHRDHDHAEASEPGHGETQLCDATSAPVIVDELDVVHHALHHLALLAQTNAAIARSLTPVALAALLPLAPMGAGVLESA